MDMPTLFILLGAAAGIVGCVIGNFLGSIRAHI